jgi:hypothetical protein
MSNERHTSMDPEVAHDPADCSRAVHRAFAVQMALSVVALGFLRRPVILRTSALGAVASAGARAVAIDECGNLRTGQLIDLGGEDLECGNELRKKR